METLMILVKYKYLTVLVKYPDVKKESQATRRKGSGSARLEEK